MVLPNGTYTLSAYVYSVTTEEDKENGGYAKMYVYEDDGLEAIEVDLEATGAWTKWSSRTSPLQTESAASVSA